MTSPLVLGIDVSKQTLAATLIRSEDLERVVWQVEMPNTRAGIDLLLQRTPAAAVWVLEPTGRYSEGVARQSVAAGRKVLMASPRKARSFLRSRPQRGKTDRADSYGLAQFGACLPLPAYPLKEARVQQVEQLLAARRELAESLGRLQQQARELPYARPALTGAIAALKGELVAVDRLLRTTVREDPSLAPVARLCQVPGIGPLIGTALCARLNDKEFRRADSFVAYVGLDITVAQSGQQRAPGQLSHEGDAELRRLLFVAALGATRSKDSPFQAEYRQLQAEGRPKTAALCIIARKLAKLAWSLHRHGTAFEPSRVYAPARGGQASEPAHPAPTGGAS